MSKKSKSFLSQAAIFLVYFPSLILAVDYSLEFLIPGCNVIGAVGAHGCFLIGFNLNELLQVMDLWGHIYWALGIGIFILIVIPAWVIGAIWTDFGKK